MIRQGEVSPKAAARSRSPVFLGVVATVALLAFSILLTSVVVWLTQCPSPSTTLPLDWVLKPNDREVYRVHRHFRNSVACMAPVTLAGASRRLGFSRCRWSGNVTLRCQTGETWLALDTLPVEVAFEDSMQAWRDSVVLDPKMRSPPALVLRIPRPSLVVLREEKRVARLRRQSDDRVRCVEETVTRFRIPSLVAGKDQVRVVDSHWGSPRPELFFVVGIVLM